MINGPYPMNFAKSRGYFWRPEGDKVVSWKAQEHPLLPHTFNDVGGLLDVFGLPRGAFESRDEYERFLVGPLPISVDDTEALEKLEIERVVQDCPFSFPKSLSIAILVDGCLDMIPALIEANNEMMGYLTKYVRARVTINGKVVPIPADAIMWATFWHISSRERLPDIKNGGKVSAGADPQIHAHNLISRWIKLDGEMYEVDRNDLFVARRAAETFDEDRVHANLEAAIEA